MFRRNTPFKRAAVRVGLLSACALVVSAIPTLHDRFMRASAAGRDGKRDQIQSVQVPIIAPGSAYRRTNLISDSPGVAPVLDPLLVNPWGMTVRGTSPFWIANNGTSTTQLVRGDVGGVPVTLNPNPQTVNIPGGLPTGAVGNSTTDFKITPPGGGTPAAANFIFDSITGNIVAWNGASGSAAQNVVSLPGHTWTGLAIGSNSGGNRLYAADFANNHIDVFDQNFTPTTVTGGFSDVTIPAGYAPFNIQNLGGSLYVAYAKVGTGGHDEEGVGNGYVRKFNTDGVRDLTFAINNGALNSPWGLTIAPASFGVFGNALLVGNFGEGNGSIHAYNPTTGAPSATDNALKDESNNDIVIDELWALQFGNGGSGGDANTLYFTAGIGEEEHGLFGKLNPTTAQATSLVQFATSNFSVDEGGGHVDFTVVRTGDTSGTATVNYATFDESQAGHASQKSHYEIAAGTLTFNPGETSKTFRILIVNDQFVEGDETVDLVLSNPTGAGVGLGSPNTSELTILDNDSAPPTGNPIDDQSFFVRQHFLDFLNREPDTAGFNALVNQITACGGDSACVATQRRAVSTAFFTSPDFMGNGSLIAQTYRAAFGPSASGSPGPVLYGQFEIDLQALLNGVATGTPSDPQLEANKQAYFNQFVTRPEFAAKYPSSLTNAQYVDNLLASANLSPADVRLFIVSLTNSQEVPPTTPTTTGGAARPASFGTARLQLNAAQTAMTLSTTASNIDFTGSQSPDTNDNLIAAHIHAGASVAPGVNGPVVWGFFGSPFNDNNPNDQRVTPFGSGVGGSITGKWDAPEGNGTTLAAQLTNLRTGHAYINFHTNQFSGGEIRGNIPPATALRDSLVAALDGGTVTRAQVLRQVAEQEELRQRESNSTAVLLAYFGYLRRDPDTAGFNYVLNRLNAFNGDINASNLLRMFLASGEYRQRFGADATYVTIDGAPVANNDTAGTNSVTPITINVLANDKDPDGDFLAVASVTAGTGGAPSITPGGRSVTFTPAPGFSGAATFQYTVTDNGLSCNNPSGCGQVFAPDPKTATATVNVNVTAASAFQFNASTATVGEGAGKVTLTATRAGDISTPATVDYATTPDAAVLPCATVNGQASERCDYQSAVGTLRFAAGDSSKTFDILIDDDARVEGNETLSVTLSNPTGTNAFLGVTTTTTVTITDNDASVAPNPIDGTQFFVRQQYLDFLNREPETAGFNAWVNTIDNCAASQSTTCDRVAVSSKFFFSDEYQTRGYFAIRFYRAAFNRNPTFREFIGDLSRLSGATTAETNALNAQFPADFVQRPEFVSTYGSLTNAQYVDQLIANTGVTFTTAQRNQFVADLNAAAKTRAQVLRNIVEASQFVSDQAAFNRAFVLTEYFGYLRRDPETDGFNNWVATLNANPSAFRTMVNGFVNSTEYRLRFGNP